MPSSPNVSLITSTSQTMYTDLLQAQRSGILIPSTVGIQLGWVPTSLSSLSPSVCSQAFLLRRHVLHGADHRFCGRTMWSRDSTSSQPASQVVLATGLLLLIIKIIITIIIIIIKITTITATTTIYAQRLRSSLLTIYIAFLPKGAYGSAGLRTRHITTVAIKGTQTP